MSGDGIYLSGTGDFNLQAGTGNYIRRISTNLQIKSSDFELTAGSLKIIGNSSSAYVKLGATTGIASTAQGTYIDNSGNFVSYGNASNYIKRNGASLDIKSGIFNLSAGTSLVIDSVTDSGTILLGANSYATAGIGFKGDGSGKIASGNIS